MICSEPVWNDWCESRGVNHNGIITMIGVMRSEGSVLEEDILGLNKNKLF